MLISPKPPPATLSTSLPPQQAPLPPAPPGVLLKQGYFKGEEGVQLFYRLVGFGKDTIVFIHGGGEGIESGGLEVEFLATKGYTFIEYDQRGMARSELVQDTSKLKVNNHVNDLESLRLYFKLQKMSLIAMSWGAAIMTYYAYQFPHQVRSLVYLSPMPPTAEFGRRRSIAMDSVLGSAKLKRLGELDSLMRKADSTTLRLLKKERSGITDPLYVADPKHLTRKRGNSDLYPDIAKQNRKNISVRRALGGEWDFRPLLKQINAPTLVIEGEKTSIPLDATKVFAEEIKGAKIILIPDSGHNSWFDQPKVLINNLDKFFRSIRKR
ncbi:hypothetical protein AAE02nite_34470 [Adhaeribacter aerolatus]|uniref:AB hydrolase-1 domain-containing protein n=2 Tax=Adhaeribacter aerolatus TaxID=670289 RepID=A0A512B1F8_9BACT|nr:hypothetical protein AAE02nite_34470 [Adhaeribacter aerolatus]